MIMEELRRIAGKEHFTRADLPASGPLTVCEAVGRPWVRVRFASQRTAGEDATPARPLSR